MPALFVGRFQPFHLGHLEVIRKITAENERLFIVIGSAESNYRPFNPFTSSERIQMIEAALNETDIQREKYEIYPVRNINNYALWVKHLELLIPPFGKVYTGSEVVKRLFINSNHKIVDIKKDLDISATMIRDLILKGGDWEKLVPPSVAELIKKWDGINRFLEIQEAEK